MQLRSDKKEIILYGNGKRCQRILELYSTQNQISILCILDRDFQKANTTVAGIPVVSLEEAILQKTTPVCITIADANVKEQVKSDLEKKFDYDLNCLIEYEELLDFFYQEYIKRKIKNYGRIYDNPTSIIFDCHNGLGLGGVEEWTKGLCEPLAKGELGEKIHILTDDKQYKVSSTIERMKDSVIRENQSLSKNDLCSIDYLISKLPLILITSQPRILKFGSMIKEFDRNQVKIISVIHGGVEQIYKKYDAYKQYVDVYVGVSEDIEHDLIKRGIPEEKVYAITCPVPCEKEISRNYTEKDCEAIKIGYAGRLEVVQKRMDLLLKLMTLLENGHVNYFFEIAGDGTYKEAMEEYVREHQLRDKVSFLGSIDRSDIPDFWKRQDICVNIADYEGRSITQVEAMVNGAVPIVTQTSGTREDIIDGQNGYLVEIGDYQKMDERIQYLSKHREVLSIMGQKAHDYIYPKCQEEVHTKFWEELLRKQEWMLLNGQ